jgi:anti-anti-sigma factor
MPLSVKIQSTSKTEMIRLSLIGQLDANGVVNFDKAVQDALNFNPTTLVLDLIDLKFISSSGLKSLAKAQRIMQQNKGKTLFVNVPPSIKKVFDIVKAVKVSDIFRNYEELDEYLEAMQRAESPP